MENILYHGYQRIQTRIGTNVDAEQLISRVLRNGRKFEDFNSSSFKKYLQKVLSKTAQGNTVRVFNNQIFLFNTDLACITVLDVPKNFQANKNRRAL